MMKYKIKQIFSMVVSFIIGITGFNFYSSLLIRDSSIKIVAPVLKSASLPEQKQYVDKPSANDRTLTVTGELVRDDSDGGVFINRLFIVSNESGHPLIEIDYRKSKAINSKMKRLLSGYKYPVNDSHKLNAVISGKSYAGGLGCSYITVIIPETIKIIK